MQSRSHPTTPVSQSDVEAYDRDGVVVLRNVVSADWIARMQDAVDRVIAAPTTIGGTYGAFSPRHVPLASRRRLQIVRRGVSPP